ncbi:hypothetical protein [Streptomyces europaeiscabiei]|uniref:hypothetical protein n=2 Tax=Streptomyces europaeiscabiei TaxID=146819 RepID=UPI0029C0C62D|nr:hypothetical protein [Streptomyces europaeiscabiei]
MPTDEYVSAFPTSDELSGVPHRMVAGERGSWPASAHWSPCTAWLGSLRVLGWTTGVSLLEPALAIFFLAPIAYAPLGLFYLDKLRVNHLDRMFDAINDANIEIVEQNAQRRSAVELLKAVPWKASESRTSRVHGRNLSTRSFSAGA